MVEWRGAEFRIGAFVNTLIALVLQVSDAASVEQSCIHASVRVRRGLLVEAQRFEAFAYVIRSTVGSIHLAVYGARRLCDRSVHAEAIIRSDQGNRNGCVALCPYVCA